MEEDGDEDVFVDEAGDEKKDWNVVGEEDGKEDGDGEAGSVRCQSRGWAVCEAGTEVLSHAPGSSRDLRPLNKVHRLYNWL